jgi:hypothetical protein
MPSLRQSGGRHTHIDGLVQNHGAGTCDRQSVGLGEASWLLAAVLWCSGMWCIGACAAVGNCSRESSELAKTKTSVQCQYNMLDTCDKVINFVLGVSPACDTSEQWKCLNADMLMTDFAIPSRSTENGSTHSSCDYDCQRLKSARPVMTPRDLTGRVCRSKPGSSQWELPQGPQHMASRGTNC